MFQLTLDAPTAQWLKSFYTDLSGTVLEYGSGGSSVLALESNPRNQLYSCETDAVWIARLGGYMSQRGFSSRFHSIYCDVGPTKEWGYPVLEGETFSHDRATQFLMAAWQPWHDLKQLGVQPDFVLIDGRWRVPSFLAAATQCERDTVVLFDDYLERTNYHVVETLVKPARMIGRAALFELSPLSMPLGSFLSDYLSLFLKPE